MAAAPAAPRKKGTLTSATRVDRTHSAAAVAEADADLLRPGGSSRVRTTSRTAPAASTRSSATGSRGASSSTPASGRSSTTTAATAVSASTRATSSHSSQKPASSSAPATPKQTVAAASASVNKVLKQLASARGQDLATLRSLYEEANKSLTVLRQHRDAVDPSKRIEIEKAALVVIGHCNDAGLYGAAAEQLTATRQSLVTLYAPARSTTQENSVDDGFASAIDRLQLSEQKKPSLQTPRSKQGSTRDAPDLGEVVRQMALFPNPVQQKARDTGIRLDDLFVCLMTFAHHVIALVTRVQPGLEAERAAATTTPSSMQLLNELITLNGTDSCEWRPDPLSIFDSYTRLGLPDSKKMRSSLAAIYTLLFNLTASRNATSRSEQVNPISIFEIQCYALRCLQESHASSDIRQQQLSADEGGASVDDGSGMLASKLYRCFAVCCKSLYDPPAPVTPARLDRLYSAIAPLLQTCFRNKASQQSSAEVSSLKSLTKLLSQIAEKEGHHTTPTWLHSARDVTPASVASHTPVKATDARMECSDASAVLTTHAMRLGQILKASALDPAIFNQTAISIASTLAHLRTLLLHSKSQASESLAAITRALARTLFYPTRALRTNTDQAVQDLCRQLLDNILAVADDLLTLLVSEEARRAVADALLALSRHTFVAKDISSYKVSLDYLHRCRTLLLRRDAEIPVRGDTFKGVVSTAYNFGATLYNDEKLASCVPFVQLACELSEVDLADPQSTSTSDDLAVRRAATKSRYELLGLAFAGIRERAEALRAYRRALLIALQDYPALALPPFEPGFLKLLGRYLRIGVLDLLQTPEQLTLHNEEPLRDRPDVQASLLEAQCSALDLHIARPEVHKPIAEWLSLASEACATAGRRTDQARVKLRQLELSATVFANFSPEQMRTLANEIAQLACESTKNEGSADCLTYPAMAHVWLGLDAIRRREVGASKILAAEAKRALAVFKQWLSDRFTEAKAVSPSAVVDRQSKLQSAKDSRLLQGSKMRTQVPSKTVVGSKRSEAPVSQATAKPLSPRNPAQVSVNHSQRTPPRKSLLARDTTKGSTRVPRSGQDNLNVFSTEQISAGLTTLACILGLYEHTFLRLSFLRLLRKVHGPDTKEHISASIDLVREYLNIGKFQKAKTVLEQIGARNSVSPTPVGQQALLALQGAQYASMSGDHEAATARYLEALKTLQSYSSDNADHTVSTSTSTSQRVQDRSELLYNTSLVADAFSRIQFRAGQHVSALEASSQAIRLVNRATANLDRLLRVSSASMPTTAGDPSGDPKGDDQSLDSSTGPLHGRLAWEASLQAVHVLLWLSEQNETRGSVKAAAFYLQQALDLAERLNAPRLRGKILVRLIDLRVASGDLEEAKVALERLQAIATEEGGLATIEVTRIKARLSLLAGAVEAAERGHEAASKALVRLDKSFDDNELQFASPVKIVSQHPARPTSTAIERPSDMILPAYESALLLDQAARLLQQGELEQIPAIIHKLQRISLLSGTTYQPASLQSRHELAVVKALLRMDPIMGLLWDSVLSSSVLRPRLLTMSILASKAAAATLDQSELAIVAASQMHPCTATTRSVKQIQACLGQLSVMRNVVRQENDTGVAIPFESRLAVSLKREMLSTLRDKLLTGVLPDDLVYPDFADYSVIESKQDLAGPWNASRARHASATNVLCPALPDCSGGLLRDGWRAVSLHVDLDRESLIVCRYQKACEPLVIQLPLDRQGRRDGEEVLFSFGAAESELRDVLAGANHTAQIAKDVKELEDRKAWWKERKNLELRLHGLLENVEKRWFGGFKSLLTRPYRKVNEMTPKELAYLEAFDLALRKAISTGKDVNLPRIQPEEVLAQCLLSLTKETSDEDLEDLLHFAVDSYQFAGVAIPCDEIDVDQAVIDLRTVLETRSDERAPAADKTASNEHLFLMLDTSLHKFPWESLPCLQGSSISRLPSLDFLRDRLEMEESKSKQEPRQGKKHPHEPFCIDGAGCSYILNPGGDLKHTQATFQPWLDSKAWKGIAGREPIEEEMKRALSTNDLFLYFGHGGGEQYIRSSVIKRLPTCASVMLWGCSSGHMQEQGEFEETGTPWTYMQAGAPSVVANLWDVTDKDIDRFTQTTFRHMGLLDDDDQGEEDKNKEKEKETTKKAVSIPLAVARSRSSCTLQYLNGAAPVVWGVPMTVRSAAL